MKTYEEMAESVLNRRDRYVAEKSRQVKKGVSLFSCFCLVALLGVGIWRSGALSNQKEIVVDGGEVDTGDEEAASGIMPGGADGSDDSSDYAKEEMELAGIADFGGDMDGDSAGYSIQKMISSFGETKMDSDISVNNGGVWFSDALTGAMEQYGGDVKYRVIVELFSDGAAIDCASEEGKVEMERFFADEGYTVAFENYNDGYVDHNYFTLHATLEQLENFPASAQYGYCVMLYGERIETTGEMQDAISGTTFTPSVTADVPVQDGSTGALNALDAVWGGSYMDEDGHWVVWLTENTKENQQKVFAQNPDLSESTTTFKTADYSLAYLTQLMADISEGMGDGKLPYVTSAALMEQDNRVEVRMTTDDADTVALIQRFDTIGGAIEIRYASTEDIRDLTTAKSSAP